MTDAPIRVLIAGIGGASLGTEIQKCLALAGRYEVFGCDISSFAYGHYQPGFAGTFLVDRRTYAASVLDLCVKNQIRAVIPGGEEPLSLLAPLAPELLRAGVRFAGNAPAIVSVCSDKSRLFETLAALDVPVPATRSIRTSGDFAFHHYPCVVKPATGTGGSRFVFLASNAEEARVYLDYVLKNCEVALLQEYLPVEEGEFTVGVLSLPDGRLAGSVAMQRLFHSKLSVQAVTRDGLISSGYSQGLIDDFAEVRAQAERIAVKLKSTGPVNIQGRLRNGVLHPFEINPRFSASTYLRAMAGFNEIDIYLRSLLCGEDPAAFRVRPGYYFRSLCEVFVPAAELKQ